MSRPEVVAAAHRHHPSVVRVSVPCPSVIERRICPSPQLAFHRSTAPSVRGRSLRGDTVYAARPFRLREHLDRLTRSLAGIRMAPPLSHAEWGKVCGELVARNGGGDQYLYVQVSRGAEQGRNHAWPEGLQRRCSPSRRALEPIAPDCWSKRSADHRRRHAWARRDIKSTALLANVLLKKLAVDAGRMKPFCWRTANSPRAPRPRCISSSRGHCAPRRTANTSCPARPAM